MAVVLDGRETSAKIMEGLKAQIEELKGKGVNPALALVLTGTDRFSRRYVRMKARRAEETGIEAQLHHLEETTTEELVTLVSKLSKDTKAVNRRTFICFYTQFLAGIIRRYIGNKQGRVKVNIPLKIIHDHTHLHLSTRDNTFNFDTNGKNSSYLYP